jgi:GNAT superfamily N-acetyltransferase
MIVIKKSNFTLVDSGLDCDTFNIIHIINGHHISDLEIESAVNHFEDKNHAYTIWIAKNQLNNKVKSILTSLGIDSSASTPGMRLNLSDYKPASESSAHEIKIVSTAEELNSYTKMLAELWKPRDENIIKYYNQISRIILENILPIEYALYFKDGIPVGGIEICITKDTLGIYGLVTIDSSRREGIGTALMHYALTHGKSKNLVTAVLQSSSLGYGIYKKLGFKIMTEYFEYGRQFKI